MSLAPVVKICGLRTPTQALAAAEAGADMLGLVFAESKRRVTLDEAQAISNAGYAHRPLLVGVFVNETASTMEQIARTVGLDLLQLSGDESPEQCLALTLPYIKVIHVQEGSSVDEVCALAQQYRRATALLLDKGGSASTPVWGGSGQALDLTLAAQIVTRLNRSVILAGGLRPDTVAHAITTVRPWGVDVSSGVETDGVKDHAKMAAFVTSARGIVESPEDELLPVKEERGVQ